MMNKIAAAALLAASGAALADCLEVSDAQFEQHQTDFGLAEVAWQARIDNSCELPYDAEMTVSFRDSEGDEVYSVQDRVIVAMGGSERVGKRLSVPKDAATRMTDLEIDIVERERPF